MTDPIQRSLFLADYVSRDKQGEKWFAIGIYEEILCGEFPSEPRTVSGFASIGDLSGRYGVDATLSSPDDAELARDNCGEVNIQVGSILTVAFSIRDVVFGEPGKHQIKIYLNGKLGAQVSVSVSQAAVHVK